MIAYGPFGRTKLLNVKDGIAYDVKGYATGFETVKTQYAPNGFDSRVEMYETAEIRKHNPKSFVSSVNGGIFYTI